MSRPSWISRRRWYSPTFQFWCWWERRQIAKSEEACQHPRWYESYALPSDGAGVIKVHLRCAACGFTQNKPEAGEGRG